MVNHARQELNPQPLVLETSALPIELLAYEPKRGLARFGVFGVLAAARAKLLQAQTLFYVLLVFGSAVIAFLAINTFQSQQTLIFGRHSILPYCKFPANCAALDGD